jgi:6-phosphogluconolactonase
MDHAVTPRVEVFADLDALGREAARRVALAVAESSGRSFTIALSGGNTPRGAYRQLAERFARLLPWERVQFFWGDERWVPGDDPASNYRMARETLLDALPIAPSQIHPIPTDLPDPEEGARRYEAILREQFGEGTPRFDLALLGIGDDGHTASLFPGSPVLDERSRLTAVTQAPSAPTTRISLTFPVLDAARSIIVLAAGASKRPIIRALLDDPEAARERYPIARLAPEGEMVLMVERDAYGGDAPRD